MLGVAAVAALLALTAVGDTCDDLGGRGQGVPEEVRPLCDRWRSPEAFNINQCDANLNRCTDSRSRPWASSRAASGNLPECSPANTDPFDTAYTACAAAARGKVGQNCLTIFGN
jgi:hypothetical protein